MQTVRGVFEHVGSGAWRSGASAQCDAHQTGPARSSFGQFRSTTVAFLCSPASFARFIGDFRNAALNAA